MINDLRKKKLKLRPVTYLSGAQGSESDIPHGYIWSPHLVPKPKGIPSCTYISYRICFLNFVVSGLFMRKFILIFYGWTFFKISLFLFYFIFNYVKVSLF